MKRWKEILVISSIAIALSLFLFQITISSFYDCSDKCIPTKPLEVIDTRVSFGSGKIRDFYMITYRGIHSDTGETCIAEKRVIKEEYLKYKFGEYLTE